MTDGLKDTHRNSIIDVLRTNSRVERAVLFGSRATQNFGNYVLKLTLFIS